MYAEAVRCRLLVGREIKTEILDKNCAKMHFSLNSDLKNGLVAPGHPAGGRPTLPDSYLSESLYVLIDVFERAWADIGWELGRIRGARKPATVVAIREALEPIFGWELGPIRDAQKPATVVAMLEALEVIRNLRSHHVLLHLLWPTPRSGTEREIRNLRRELAEAIGQSRETESAVRRQILRCEESAQAVLLASGEEESTQKAIAEAEDQKRKVKLEELEKALDPAKHRRESLQKELQEREAFFAQNEMLDFLRSKRYELTPRNLARALACMPYMRWRQSVVRCRKIPCEMAVSIYYQVFQAISWLLRGSHPKRASEAVQFFKERIPKLPPRHNLAQTHLKENWPHLRKAIEDRWEHCPLTRKLPYELTASFTRNKKTPTNALDRILAAQG